MLQGWSAKIVSVFNCWILYQLVIPLAAAPFTVVPTPVADVIQDAKYPLDLWITKPSFPQTVEKQKRPPTTTVLFDPFLD